MAGSPIRHTFQIQNRTSSPIQLANRDGIQMSCGCTAAHVESKSLAPGESTAVEIQLNTTAKRGDVSEVVTTSWTTPHQTRVDYTFQIQAHIQAALTLKPSEVVFTKKELTEGVNKRIECTSDLDLDWNRTEIVPLADELAIQRRQILEDGLVFEISFSPSGEDRNESRKAMVQIVVPRVGAARRSAHRISESLLVHWPASGSTRFSPAIVSFHANPDSHDWQGWFIVMGQGLRETSNRDSIESIEASAANIEFRERRLAASAIRVDATMTLKRGSAAERPRWIDVVLTSGERKRLRILFSDRHIGKET
jgi:hypothetical protein